MQFLFKQQLRANMCVVDINHKQDHGSAIDLYDLVNSQRITVLFCVIRITRVLFFSIIFIKLIFLVSATLCIEMIMLLVLLLLLP